MPKIVQFNLPPGGTVVELADNTSEALDIESTDGAEYVKIDTTNSNEKLILGDGLPATGAVCIGTDDNKLNTTLQQLTVGHPDASAKTRVHIKGTNNGSLLTINSGAATQASQIDFMDGESQDRWSVYKGGNGGSGVGNFTIQGKTGASGAGTTLKSEYGSGKWCLTTDGNGPSSVTHDLQVQDGDLGIVTNSADAVAKSLVFTKSRNATDGDATIVDNNDVLGRIDWYAADASSGTTADNKTISASIYSQIDGTPGDGAMPGSIRFATTSDGASSVTDRFVIRQNGNIGLGDTEPNYRAVIGGGLSTPILYAYNSNTSELTNGVTSIPNGAAGAIFDHRAATSIYCMNTTSTNAADGRSTGIAFFGRTDEASDEYPMQGALRVKHEGSAADQKGYMAFYTNAGTDDRAPTERMRIDSSGDVKIIDGNALDFYSSGETVGGSVRLSVYGAGSAATIRTEVSTTDLVFGTNSTERVRIKADTGRVGIGLNNPAYALDVVGNAGKSVGGTAWVDTSDARIKTNVENIENALDKISQLRPVSFNYTEDYLSVHPEIDGSKRYNSFVAQEYAEVFPDAVTSTATLERVVAPESEGVEEVRETLIENLHQYTPHDLTMYLVKAVQELSAKVTALEEAQGN